MGGAVDQALQSLRIKPEWKRRTENREERKRRKDGKMGRRGLILVTCLVAGPKYPDEAA